MTLTVEQSRQGDFTVLWVVDACRQLAALICAAGPLDDRRALLSPVRIIVGNYRHASSGRESLNAVRQTESLRRKINAIDRLGLVSTKFADQFSAARLFVFCASAQDGVSRWQFAERALRLIRERIGCRIVVQLDYDQRRLHPELSGMLDSIDFQTKHSPSATASVVSVRTILRCKGIAERDSIWAIKGAGEVGSRIVAAVEPGVRRVYVAERLQQRRALMEQLPCVAIVDSNQLAHMQTHVLLFAADAGSLNMDVARAVAANRSIVVVGGPEAALDRGVEGITLLAAAGKCFVPSVLCGSLGLISNLQEILGNVTSLSVQSQRLASIVERMAFEAVDRGLPFHEICLAVLQGRSEM